MNNDHASQELNPNTVQNQSVHEAPGSEADESSESFINEKKGNLARES